MATLSHPRAWLRHPLRQRPVPPGHPRRLAAGNARGLARHGNPWEFERPRSQLRDRLRRLGRNGSGRRRARRATSGSRPRPSRRSPTTRRSSAGAAGTSTRCACGRRARSIRSCSTRSTPATMSARCRNGAGRGDLPGPLSQRRHAGRAGTAAAAGVFLLLRLAAGHHPPPHQAVSATCARLPTRRRSSSTTPIRRSPSPN